MNEYPYEQEMMSSNLAEYSVTELSMALKQSVEERFGFVRVRGEISGLKRAASGHVYLNLKDDKSVIDGVMWKGISGNLSFRPEDGLEVICTGKLTTYPGRSKYQIVIERMEPAGAGALMALLEERKRNGNTLWRDAAQKEMNQVKIAFKLLEKDDKVPADHSFMRCHMVFDIKTDFFSEKGTFSCRRSHGRVAALHHSF